jgi:CRISPR-associated protein Csx17
VSLHLHHLEGCAPTPLAHYLKALGILRIIAQQKDPEVRGFWTDQHFCLLTSLDREELEAFFLEEYAPTPFVSPWNKGSGFFAASDKGLTPIENSSARRFAPFREGIRAARVHLGALEQADAAVRRLKAQTKAKRGTKAARAKNDPEYKRELAAAENVFKRLKADLFAPFALAWRGPHRDWMDAAMVLSQDGEPSWPALLGTGGNDGRLDFTNAAMQRLGDLFDLDSPNGAPAPTTTALVQNTLFGLQSAAILDAAVGQFLPGFAGGANGTTGPDAGSRVNPWDFVLTLEGTIAFRGQATRRLGGQHDTRAAIPFAVSAQAVGHATRGKEKDLRGEQWMPLWTNPATWNDVAALLGEGRVQLGRVPARRPLEFARAVSKLGVARGVSGFVRYGFLERNGQSNLAVPLGRIDVAARPRSRLIDDIGGWLDRLQRQAEDAPARLSGAVGVLSDSVFDALTRDAEPLRWQSILLAVDQVERVLASGTAFKVGPCPKLSAGWLAAADDGSTEWRLALALGSGAARYERGRPTDGVRAHALPIDPRKPWSFAVGADKRLVNDPRVVMAGRDGLTDLVTLVERRLIESAQSDGRALRLVPAPGATARLDDLATFIDGEVDIERVVGLGRALMAVDWAQARISAPSIDGYGRRPDEAWESLRLTLLPYAVNGRTTPCDPAIFRRLESGNITGAVSMALRRLRASGFRPPLDVAVGTAASARAWAAAFAFPIAPTVAEAMAARFEPRTSKETL